MPRSTKTKGLPKTDPNDPQCKIIIDWEEFEKLCGIQATETEIADWFGCNAETLNNKVKDHYGATFREVFKRKSARGKISLRRQQFQTAMGVTENGKYIYPPNARMQIWLGKQYLKQADKNEISGPDGNPIKIQSITFGKDKIDF